MTLLCAAWAWNRVRAHKVGPLVIRSLLGALLVFEICVLLGLGQLDRAAWTGAWGFAGALALRSALGLVGSWVVAGTLFAVTLLAATELGFHWIARLARRALVDPAVGLGTAWGEWREARAARGQAGPKPKGKKEARPAAAPDPGRAAEARGTEPREEPARPRISRPLDQLDLPLPVGQRPEPKPKAKEPKPKPAPPAGDEKPREVPTRPSPR